MAQGVLHSYRKEQREAVNDLVRKVIITDMANFNPERFRDWAKNLNYQQSATLAGLATLASVARTWYEPGRADDATVTQPGRLMVRFQLSDSWAGTPRRRC